MIICRWSRHSRRFVCWCRITSLCRSVGSMRQLVAAGRWNPQGFSSLVAKTPQQGKVFERDVVAHESLTLSVTCNLQQRCIAAFVHEESCGRKFGKAEKGSSQTFASSYMNKKYLHDEPVQDNVNQSRWRRGAEQSHGECIWKHSIGSRNSWTHADGSCLLMTCTNKGSEPGCSLAKSNVVSAFCARVLGNTDRHQTQYCFPGHVLPNNIEVNQ